MQAPHLNAAVELDEGHVPLVLDRCLQAGAVEGRTVVRRRGRRGRSRRRGARRECGPEQNVGQWTMCVSELVEGFRLAKIDRSFSFMNSEFRS